MFLFFVTCFVKPIELAAMPKDINAESAILVDGETGKILYSKNIEKALPPASMTKVMTEYLVWDAIDSGQISWDTKVEISDFVYDISANNDFSGVGLRKEVKYSVKELYEAMAINSDNATTIALAELISGSEGEFVKLMNEKGEELGLPQFKFVNSTGLENESLGENRPAGTNLEDTNLLSAKSAALLAYHLINEYPEALDISSVTTTEFDGQEIRNWNWMLPHDATFLKQHYYEGIDGLKTGNTSLAGYNFTGTANRNGKRLITVVMNTDSVENRFKETAKLMDYGYNNFEETELFPAGYQLQDKSTIPVTKGKAKSVNIELKDSITSLIKKGDQDKYTVKYEIDESLLNEAGELIAPIEKGTKVGKAKLVIDSDTDYGYILSNGKSESVDLITTEAVEKKNWLSLLLSSIGELFTNLFNKIKGLF